MTYIFWLSLTILLYTYFGYPLYAYLRARMREDKAWKAVSHKPFVSVIFSAYNEGEYIHRRIVNLLDSEYPKDRIEILVGSDGSTDNTNAVLGGIHDKRVKAFTFEKRRGKVSVLNDLVPKAKGDIVVFCDVRQIFDSDAIRHLVANFADKKIGCVSGELVFTNSSDGNGVSEGVGIYWNYEKLIRKSESAAHSMIGATGAIYAIRKNLYSPPPDDTILDDVYIPLAIVRKGYRSILDCDAKAYDKPAFTPKEEYRRKVRTLSGNYQIFKLFMDLMIPFASPVTGALISHKLLRVIAPFLMITLFVSNVFIAKHAYYGSFLILQIAFYVMAVMRISSVAYMFCFMNYTALVGLWRFITGRQKIAWEK